MQLQVKVPKGLGLRKKIVRKYSELYQEYCRFYPGQKEYTYKQLRQNIAEVVKVANKFVDSSEIRNTTFIPWLDNEWKQFYFKHWYFAVDIKLKNNTPIAIVRDAHYEGDHHNDLLLTKPYDLEDLAGARDI